MSKTLLFQAAILPAILLIGACQQQDAPDKESEPDLSATGGDSPERQLPGCGVESTNSPDCGEPDPVTPEPPPKEPKPPKEPIPREPREPDDPRGWILATEPGGTFAVKATVRCKNGRIGVATLANRTSAVDQAFADCAD